MLAGANAKVEVRPDDAFSERFPEEHSARVRLQLRDGDVLEREQRDYEGFHTRPMSWDTVAEKFDRLAERHVDEERRTRIKEAVANLDELAARNLMRLLGDLDD